MQNRPRNTGILLGFRSGLEEKVARELVEQGIEIRYEAETIRYTRPARAAKYTPDWILPNGIIVETKGRFLVDDRQKHLIIKEQHPGLDIRFVFSNSRARLSKNSNTTYAAWCEKHGFIYADKSIPQGWLMEPPCDKRFAAIEEARIK